MCLFFRQNDGDSFLQEEDNPIPQLFHNALWIRKKRPSRTNFLRQKLDPSFLDSQSGDARVSRLRNALINLGATFAKTLFSYFPLVPSFPRKQESRVPGENRDPVL